MSKEAEEYYKKILVYDVLNSDEESPLIHRGVWQIMEAYHQSRVNAISDEDITFENEMTNGYKNGMEGTYEEGKFVGFDNGADWFKNKLKQYTMKDKPKHKSNLLADIGVFIGKIIVIAVIIIAVLIYLLLKN